MKYKLSEVLELIGGGTPKTAKPEYWNGDIPWLSVKDFNNDNRYVYQTEKTITQLGLDNSSTKLLHQGDVIISARGTVGEVATIPFPMAFNQSCYGLRAKRTIVTKDFLYYLIKHNVFILKKNTHGSVFDTITRDTFEGIEVDIPDLKHQRKISIILSNLDAKIELNNAINKNLEQQAQAIFKSWFVDFTPFNEPFKENPVGIQTPVSLKMLQIADIPHILETGRRPKGGAVAEGIPSVGAENVKTLGLVNLASVKFIPKEFAEKMKTGAVNGYELMLYKDGGKPGTFIPHFSMFGEGFPYENFFINEHVFKLDFYNRGYNEFMYFYLQTNYPYYWLSNNGGKAAVPGINQQDVNSIWTFAPENPKVKEFCDWVHPLFKCILTNCAKNVKLAALRDLLLPKLMSGELDVSAIDL